MPSDPPRSSVQRYLAASPVVLYAVEFNEDDYRVVWASQNVEGLLGYSLEEALQPDWWEAHVHPDDLTAARQGWQEALAGKRSRHTYRFLRKDGTVIWVLDTLEQLPAQGEEPGGLVGAWTDVSSLREETLDLRTSEERLQLALHAGAQGVWDLDLMADVARVSPEYALMLGYDPETFHESNAAWRARTHPDDQAKAGRIFDDYVAGRLDAYRLEFRQRTASGGWKWILSVGEIVERDGEGRPVRMLGTHTDITALKESEARALAWGRLTEALLDHVSEGVVACDASGRLTLFNQLARSWHGLGPDESLPPKDWARRYNLFHADGETLFAPSELPLVRALKGEVVHEVAMTIITDGQPPRWVLVSGGPVSGSQGDQLGAVVLMKDITSKREAEAAIRLREEALKAAATAMVITNRDGIIEWVNPAFTELSGYSFDEAVGLNPRDLVRSGEQAQAFYAQLWETVLAGGHWEGELVNRRKDGTLYPEGLSINPVRDRSGEISHFVAFKRDLTEERVRQAQLLQSQKMESVGRLAGGVAHDFNNLLTVINGTVELAMSALKPEDPHHADFATVRDAAQRATALTRQLLTFSRQGSFQPRDVSLNTVITHMLKMLRRLVGEDLEFVTELAQDAGIVRVDVTQLEQVIMNVTLNARDAMPQGGRISISTAPKKLSDDPSARPEGVPTGDFVRLTVKDTGVGMTPEVKARLFEPFFTTKPMGKGTGLGLATVYGIVKRSGGSVTVESTPGNGSAFHIFLPRLTVRESTHVDSDPHLEVAPGSGTILVVDDEPALRRVTQRILERAGYTVLVAGSGREALKMVQSIGGELDLLLTDVVMPEMSGPELVTALRKSQPKLRVLFSSGYADETLATHGVDANEFPFVSKPFSISELTRKVKEALQG